MKTIANTATTTRSAFASTAGGFVSTPPRHEVVPSVPRPARKASGQDNAQRH